MERLVRFFVERHLLVNVITIAVVVIGVGTALRTNVRGFPGAEMPRFGITANMPGASARDVETKVTIPIEDELREIDGLDSFTTVVTDNRSVTNIELDDDTPDDQILEKETEIRNAIEAITNFPADMRDEPRVFRFDPDKEPIVEIALAGPKALLPDVAKRVERVLLRTEGVGQVNMVGLPDPELRVLVDPEAVRAHGVTLLEIVRAIQQRNVSDTGGVLESAGTRRQVVMWGRFDDPMQVGDVILRFANDGPLKVSDVARIELTREDTGVIAGTNGRPGLSVVAIKKPDADIITTKRNIDEAIAKLDLPEEIQLAMVNDSSYEMRNRLRIIGVNGLMGIVLVAGIVFLFLAPSAAIWVCAGVPLVILGVLIVIPQVGMTINFVSTIAFVIVLGMLVDDAVVVAEKVLLRRQEGLSPAEAAVSGTMLVARPVIASAATTLLAFAPMMAIGGMPQKLVWQIPAVVTIALALSLLESFFILPAHMSMVRGGTRPGPKRTFVLALEAAYRAALERALPHRGKVIAVFAGIFFAIVGIVLPRLEFEFFPQDSSPGFAIKVDLPAGAPLERTEAAIDAIQRQLPTLMGDDLLAMTSRVGHQDLLAIDREYGSAENEGFVQAHLDLNKMGRTAAEWIAHLRATLRIPADARVTYEAEVDGPPGLQPVMVYVMANDHVLRRQTSLALRQYLESIDGVVDVSLDEREGMRQIDLQLDANRLARRGLSAEEVGRTIKTAFFGTIASEIRDLEQTTEIRVLFEPSARRSVQALLDTTVRNAAGELIVLRDVVVPAEVPALAKIQHRNGFRAATVSAGFTPDSGLTATSVAELLEAEFLPRYAGRTDIELEIGGEVVQSRRAVGDLAFVAVVVVIGIAAVIAIMLGSFLEAFFVVAVVPFSAAFVALTFWAHGMNFSLLPVIGTIGLAGVVVNASIVMVDSVHRAQHAVAGADETARTAAMIDALVARLRPVVVTGLSTFGGVMPTAYGLGGWDPVMSPMSLALGWGLALASGVTLFLVPALYVTASDLNRAIDRWRGRASR